MAQNEPQHIETPPGPSPNSPSHHYYLNIGVQAANLSDWRIESNRIETFLPELECYTEQQQQQQQPRDAATRDVRQQRTCSYFIT